MISRLERRSGNSKSQYLFFAVIGIFVMIIALAGFLTVSSKPKIISPLPEDYSPDGRKAELLANKENPEQLKELVTAAVGNDWLNYSVLVADLHSDFRMAINDSVIYEAASVNKIPILAGLYVTAQQDDSILKRIITLQKKDIQDYGTGSLRYSEPGSTYSVKTLAQLMMKQSDNTAAFVLGNYIVGLDKLQVQVDAWGLTQTDIQKNTTSNQDMEILLRKIYGGKVANAAFTQEMLSFMKETDFEDRLPALLPPGTVVYHKIGSTIGGIHDVGIVVTPQHAYYIGIFTADIKDEPATIKKISEISKLVYDFMN